MVLKGLKTKREEVSGKVQHIAKIKAIVDNGENFSFREGHTLKLEARTPREL